MRPVEEQLELIKRGADEIISIEELKAKLKQAKPLVIKAGFDPSAPDLHLGHTVLLRKLKHFQDLGHKVFFLIGDFTGRIGDPSGKSKTRPQLTQEAVDENAKTYKKQIFKILDETKTQIVFNSEWCAKLGTEGIFNLASRYTVARMMERDDFSKRYANNEPVSILEFLYPLLQGYDSVVMKADVELGGTDQKFNLLVGRDLQRSWGMESQVILTMPILEGLDGVDKMSKSLNNYVGISEAPEEMFGKIMSISDTLMWKYYELLTDEDHISLKKAVEDGSAHPKKVKSDLAKIIVEKYYNNDTAEKARLGFESVFAKGELPDDIREFVFGDEKVSLIEIMITAALASSKSEARRLVEQNAVSIDGEKMPDANAEITLNESGKIIKVGKRKFAKILRAAS
ncbi:MAG: tyrosine--tRNA ligase [Candidatus Omnitrophica bacterium]|nr:tyrosine--tRNA ligase [Candidatus Omnitrophota bacterium]